MKLPILYQRIEAAMILATSLYFYHHLHFNFLLFALILLLLDIFMIGYIISNKLGAQIYNVGHSMLIPPALLVLGSATNTRTLIGLSLIWFAHIGMDRALGYGLKLLAGFSETHLGHIGKQK